jgi:hypothetical protein
MGNHVQSLGALPGVSLSRRKGLLLGSLPPNAQFATCDSSNCYASLRR